MKNVTVTMEESVAEWARLEAARRNTSVSRLIGELLADKMRRTDRYERAMREALKFRPLQFEGDSCPGTRSMPSDSTVFVDTNVLLYALDPRNAGKQTAARVWLQRCWQQACGRISTQVLNELYANLRRVAPTTPVEEARRIVREYRAWTPWIVDDETVDRAWDLQDRFQFSYWDALMVAAAQQLDCNVLLTEDLQHRLQVDRLRIVNPFLAGPELLDAPTA